MSSRFDDIQGAATSAVLLAVHGEPIIYTDTDAAHTQTTLDSVVEEGDKSLSNDAHGLQTSLELVFTWSTDDIAAPNFGARITFDGVDWEITSIRQLGSTLVEVRAVRVDRLEQTGENYRRIEF